MLIKKQMRGIPRNTRSENQVCNLPCSVNGIFLKGIFSGKPNTGSVVKIPEPVKPMPTNANNTAANLLPVFLLTAMENKKINSPDIIKVQTCIQPFSPIASELIGYRKPLYPFLNRPCMQKLTIKMSGPANPQVITGVSLYNLRKNIFC